MGGALRSSFFLMLFLEGGVGGSCFSFLVFFFSIVQKSQSFIHAQTPNLPPSSSLGFYHLRAMIK